MSATLATMEPGEVDAEADEGTLAALGADGLTYRVWGGDWCPDCTGQLPRFAAALDAAGVPADRVEQYPVEKVDGEKRGPGMDEYGVTHIPTVIVFDEDGESSEASRGSSDESDGGDELARFVESAETDIATYLAREIGAADA